MATVYRLSWTVLSIILVTVFCIPYVISLDTGHDVTQPYDTETHHDNGNDHHGNDTDHHGNDTDHHGNDTGHHGDGHHGVHLASINFEHVRQPLTITIFLIVVAACKLGFHHANVLSSIVPESCLLIIIGTIVGGIMHATGTDRAYFASFSSDLFFLYLLPPIILEAAYSLHDRVFFDNLGTILLFAVVGTVFNCFIISPVLYGLSLCGAMGTIQISLIQCFVFGSLVVAVDPVAVLAIFQEIGVNNVLYFLVFGESLLNDAVTVVIYNTMNAFSKMDTIPYTQILLGIASFFTISLGGLAIGILVGALCSFFTRFTRHVRVVEPLAVFALAYASYLLAELFHFSGIISIIGCGLMQAQYCFHNLSHKSNTTVKYFGKMLSATCDSVIFLFLGLSLVSDEHEWHTGFVLWSVLLCLLIRFGTVYFLTFIANRVFRLRKVDWEEQFIMAYGGLRGAVAFSLVAMLDREYIPKQPMLQTTTLAVIIFTVFVQGISIKPLVKLLRISKAEKSPVSIYEEINYRVTDHLMAGIEEICGHYGHNFVREKLDDFDNRYLRRWLMRNPNKKDDDIMEIYHTMALQMHLENIQGCNTFDDFTSDLNIYQPPTIMDDTGQVAEDLPAKSDLAHQTLDLDAFRRRTAFLRSASLRGSLQYPQRSMLMSPGITSPGMGANTSPYSTLSTKGGTPSRQLSRTEPLTRGMSADHAANGDDTSAALRRARFNKTMSEDVFIEQGNRESGGEPTSRRKSMFGKLFKTGSEDIPETHITEPTVDHVRKWLVKNPTREGYHHKYDRNLTSENQSDLIHHLEEKRRRNFRRRVSLARQSLAQSPVGSMRGMSPRGSTEDIHRRLPLGVITEGTAVTRFGSNTPSPRQLRVPSRHQAPGRTSSEDRSHAEGPTFYDSQPTLTKDQEEGDTTPLLQRSSPENQQPKESNTPATATFRLNSEVPETPSGDSIEEPLVQQESQDTESEPSGKGIGKSASGLSIKGRGHLARQVTLESQDDQESKA